MEFNQPTEPSAPANRTEQPPVEVFNEDINFDEAINALGEDGFNAVAGALDMFRKK